MTKKNISHKHTRKRGTERENQTYIFIFYFIRLYCLWSAYKMNERATIAAWKSDGCNRKQVKCWMFSFCMCFQALTLVSHQFGEWWVNRAFAQKNGRSASFSNTFISVKIADGAAAAADLAVFFYVFVVLLLNKVCVCVSVSYSFFIFLLWARMWIVNIRNVRVMATKTVRYSLVPFVLMLRGQNCTFRDIRCTANILHSLESLNHHH